MNKKIFAFEIVGNPLCAFEAINFRKRKKAMKRSFQLVLVTRTEMF
jgi:hypothetical protein